VRESGKAYFKCNELNMRRARQLGSAGGWVCACVKLIIALDKRALDLKQKYHHIAKIAALEHLISTPMSITPVAAAVVSHYL